MQKIKLEKKQTQKEYQHRKEDREEQMGWFEKIVKLHDNEYTKYMPTRYTGNDVDVTMAQDDEADQKKLKELYEGFELDEWGKTGLEIGNKEEAANN